MAQEPLADIIARGTTNPAPFDAFALPNYMSQIRSKIKETTTRRFRFDENACAVLRSLVLEHPRDLIAQLDMARPPYDAFWLEIPLFADHWGDLSFKDYRTGYLVSDGEIHDVAWHRDTNWLQAPWWRASLAGWSREEQEIFFREHGIGPDAWRLWFLGTGLSERPEWADLSDEECRRLLDHIRIDLHGLSPEVVSFFNARQQGTLAKVTVGGVPLVPIAAMILLNTKPAIREIAVPYSRGFCSGKLRQMREHTNVTLSIGQAEVVKYITSRPERESLEEITRRNRRHEVRGHMAHNRLARETACVHDWVTDSPRQWHCGHCGGRRWWKMDFERGTGEMPERTYLVTN